MHLIELIATLEGVKVARGNIELVDVLVVGKGDTEPVADHSGRREKAPPARLVIDITGMGSDQVEELVAENPGAMFHRRTCNTAGCLRPPDHADDHLFKKCDRVSDTRGPCTLTKGHEGDHAWELPVKTDLANATAELGATMEAAAAKLPPEGDGAEVVDRVTTEAIDTTGAEVVNTLMPCPQFDDEKRGCVLAFGHEGDHDFTTPENLQE